MYYESGMNSRQMRYFLAVAEELNFRKAAERLHMTQPPLSQQIGALEEELGVALFLRNRRRVELTDAGAALCRGVRRILDDMESAKRRAMDIGTGKTGRLRIGFIGPAIDGPLPSDIRRYKSRCPGVVLDLHELTTNQQLDRIRDNSLDAGFVRLIGHDPSGLKCRLYHRERYLLAVPDDHPMANQSSVSLADLDGEPLIMFPRTLNRMLHDKWTAAFTNAGATMHVVQEAATKHSCLALAAAGHGLTPVPESTANTGRSGVSFVHLHGDIPSLEFHVAVRETAPSPVLETFLNLLISR